MVSIHRSQRADALVVHTDKLKLFLGTILRSWLKVTNGPSEIETILASEFREHVQSPA